MIQAGPCGPGAGPLREAGAGGLSASSSAGKLGSAGSASSCFQPLAGHILREGTEARAEMATCRRFWTFCGHRGPGPNRKEVRKSHSKGAYREGKGCDDWALTANSGGQHFSSRSSPATADLCAYVTPNRLAVTAVKAGSPNWVLWSPSLPDRGRLGTPQGHQKAGLWALLRGS